MATQTPDKTNQKTFPISTPLLDGAEVSAASAVIESGWLMQGPQVEGFEKDFALMVGAKHAIALANGTAALHLALDALGVGQNDFVITVSHSFIATANAVRLCGAEPLFVDIEKDGLNMDPKALESFLADDCVKHPEGGYTYKHVDKLRKHTESPLALQTGTAGRIKAIMPVHQIGVTCDLESIMRIAKKYDIPVVEDAACAVGSELSWEGRREVVGRPHSLMACFSFHPRKILTTGDGGMITTNSDTLAARIRLRRNHGMQKFTDSSGAAVESYETTAFNYRLTDLQAAVGREQLKKLPGILKERHSLAAHYAKKLASIPGLRCLDLKYGASDWNVQSLPIWIERAEIQKPLIRMLHDHRVMVKSGIMNAHEATPYKGLWSLPHSESSHRHMILLPLFSKMTSDDIDEVVARLALAMTELMPRL